MIKTERLTLRRVRAEDWSAIREIWADAAKSAYARYDRPNDTDDRSVRRRIARWASFADSDAHVFAAVCLQERVIGYVVLHRREAGGEIGYCFHSAYHGYGYARESVSALLDWAKARGLTRVTAGTALKNVPSVKLLRSLGFRSVGTERLSFRQDAEGKPDTFEGGIFELPLTREDEEAAEQRDF